jgi:hypothetical protein
MDRLRSWGRLETERLAADMHPGMNVEICSLFLFFVRDPESHFSFCLYATFTSKSLIRGSAFRTRFLELRVT